MKQYARKRVQTTPCNEFRRNNVYNGLATYTVFPECAKGSAIAEGLQDALYVSINIF